MHYCFLDFIKSFYCFAKFFQDIDRGILLNKKTLFINTFCSSILFLFEEFFLYTKVFYTEQEM